MGLEFGGLWELRKSMESNFVVEYLPYTCKNVEQRAASLLNHVQGEFEDEDGDWATAFIVADPVPQKYAESKSDNGGSGISSSYNHSNSGRKRQFKDEADASFVCSVCELCVPLEILGPDLKCGCLSCESCLREHVEFRFSRACPESEGGDPGDFLRRQSFRQLAETLSCPSCSCAAAISLPAAQLLAPEAYQKWQEEANEVLFKTADFVRCPGCNVMIEKVIGDIPAGVAPSGVPEFDRTVPFIEHDDDGKPMSRAALFHKFSNFFRCALCKVGFCGLCMTTPYHLGYTCEDYEVFKNATRCIYCEAPIRVKELMDNHFRSLTVKDLQRDLDREGVDASWCVEKRELVSVRRLASSVCDAKDCRRRLGKACTRSLECGHRCGGLRGERACLPCLQEGCHENVLLRKGHSLPSADDWCPICMVEPLRSAPSIQLKCGHIVHFECAKKKIKEGFPGPEISFGYLNCPECAVRMEHESLMHDLRKPLELLNLVKEKALKRLKMEKMQSSMEQGELETFALRKYQYYTCCKCQNPYFGGNRDCAADLGLQANGDRSAHNPLELVCGGCSAAMGDLRTCSKGHGKQYVEYKCRYCCSMATYFCFGRTHFCSGCHVTRPDGNPDFVPPQCRGPQSCPLSVHHAPNGEEFCLGCSMCRLLSQ